MILSPLVAERDRRRLHDWPLILVALVLTLVGIAAINSVDMAVSAKAGVLQSFAVKQCVFGAVGMVGLVAVSYCNTELWRRVGGFLYWVNMLMLGAVLVVGKTVNGSKRWLVFGPVQVQPGDFAKIIVILTLAAFFVANIERIREWSTLWRSLRHIAPPMVLLLLEPHYGGAACIFVAWVLMALYAGMPWRHIGAVVVALLVLLGAGFASPQILGKVLQPFQVVRIQQKIDEILGHNKDPKGAGYQQSQSELAVAVGGTVGVGYGRGERKQAKFIPEQQSDFIFSVVGEELGFAGSAAVVLLFGFFLYRVWLVSYRCVEDMDKLVAAGILAVLGFHTVTNLAMVLNAGLVVGLWLPFMSAGGTALVACLAMVGLLDSLR